ncbi:uncharacterized protein LOC121640335 [Melanotaenia boesemani]|uniref:uncharacterized protein LOC121640335 n=1 Tax=Melanotaenia boesemani TaxID=1250792 RepID=UPI001C051D60|nr:uncharacterized protein LOC121640335 [Melanotaenia boesemani]
MSLRSGKNYLKDFAGEQQDEATSGEQQPEVSPQPATTQQQSQPLDTRSQSSRRTSKQSQRSSSTTSSATRAYAKAKAARAQLAFAEKEANMMKQKAELEASMLKQKADLDASLHLLQCQKAAAAAEAEAVAYEEAELQSGEFSRPQSVEFELSAAQRTSEYVQQQSELLFPDIQDDAPDPERNDNEVDVQDSTRITKPVAASIQTNPSPVKREMKPEPTMSTYLTNTYLPGPPKQTTNLPDGYMPTTNSAQDFAKYLIRKELVSTGLLQFDDRPENYWAWKTSFLSATNDLNLSPREELDLLTRWLGPKSSEQAKRIRAVHTLNPAAGAKMVWQRLEECYGSPEVIEDALLKKTEEFPKLTNKDNVKLQELSDILMELKFAKQDGALPGLAYLDTARGFSRSLFSSKRE